MSISFLMLIFLGTPNLFSAEINYPGYIPIGRDNLSLFYWLFKSRAQLSNAPLVIFLPGGPGCDIMKHVFMGNGPYDLSLNGTLTSNPLSWNNFADVLFMDEPVCTGFSICNDISQSPLDDDGLSADMLAFLTGLYHQFPEYVGRSIYLTGHSYGGHSVPSVGEAIMNLGDPKFVLSGMAIGNGWFNGVVQSMAYPEYSYQRKLINNFQKITGLLSYYVYSFFGTRGVFSTANTYKSIGDSIMVGVKHDKFCIYNYLEDYTCGGDSKYETALIAFFKRDDVRASLPVIGSNPYSLCNYAVYPHMIKTVVLGDSSKKLEKLMNNGVKTILYAGALDYICNYDTILAMLRSLDGWNNLDNLNSANSTEYYINDQIKGKMTSLTNFTLILVNGAGHMVTDDDRLASFDILQRLIN